MIYIGIDCGHDTGLAVWDTGRRVFRAVATLRIHRAMEAVLDWQQREGPVVVVFEDARQRRYFAREKSESEYRGHLMGAGSVKRDAVIWQDFLSDKGIPFQAVPPRRGLTKWDAKVFARTTGWTGRTSNHARDAALLVFQKPPLRYLLNDDTDGDS